MRGTTLGDRYRLDEWLGGGSMGDVWLARDQVLDRRVAVKILKPALLDEPGFAERFHDEARVMARLRHPGIVGVYDFGPGRAAGDVPSWGAPPLPAARPVAYLVMELIVGEPLSTVLERRGPLTVPETLGLALEVLAALEAAHEAGIVHRDIKPANLMVRDGHLVITDFGIARPGCDARLTVPGMVLGTAAYQAPEQASTGTVTSSADLYALGVVLYECLTGRLPFEGETALELILKHLTDPVPPLPADVPAPVRALVERAMAKDPALRWPGAAAMAAAVRAALAGEPVEGLPVGTMAGGTMAGGVVAGGTRAGAAAIRSTGAMAALRSTGVGPLGSGAGPLGTGVGPLGTGVGPLGTGVGPLGSGAYPFGTGAGPLGSGAYPFGTAAREAREALAAAAPPRRAARWRAAFFGSRRRTLLVASAAVLCCAATATGAVLLHRTTAVAGSVAAGSAAGSTPAGVPLTAAVGLGPDAGTPSPSPSAPAPSATLLPGVPGMPGAPLPEPGTGAGGPVAGTAGGPAGRDTAPNAPTNPGAPAAGSAAGPGTPVDGAGAQGGPGAPGSSAANPPERPSTSGPAYTAVPPPPDPAYTAANPRRTVPPAYPTSSLPPAPVYTPPPAYTPPPYTAAPPPPPPPGTFPTDPPIKPPTRQPGPLPARARVSIAGSVLASQASLDRDGNPVVLAPDDGGPGGVWQLTKRAEGGYLLFNGATQYSKALDLEETGSQTRLWHSPPPGPNQVWSFTPVAGGYLLTVQGDQTRCLSAAGPNVPATVRPCEASADQVWTVSAA
ncbi:serine/threonine protein kinase [Kitasatospora misakiensis]|uniref:non-specific serine/threonine protein kinase n=1 Tax=Kitasatospora misakiensis TaxID=67330 RepID=A0ABW0WZP0_9ACTN